MQGFPIALCLWTKLWCRARLFVKSISLSYFGSFLFIYTWAWNMPYDSLSHIKDFWKVEKMTMLAAPKVFPHIVCESVQNLSSTLSIAGVPQEGCISRSWCWCHCGLGYCGLGEEVLLFFSVFNSRCILKDTRDTYWSVGSERGLDKMTPWAPAAELFVSAVCDGQARTNSRVLCNWNGCSNSKHDFTVFISPCLYSRLVLFK